MVLLLRALAGSRLYGTASAHSDFDWYEVHDHIKTSQKKRDGDDTVKMPVSQWLWLAEQGTHQALDAMWCPPQYTEVDELTAFRLAWRPDPWRVGDQLERSAFGSYFDRGDDKHLYRLLYCAHQVREYGWYDPSDYGR